MDKLGYILLADDNEYDLELEMRALSQYRVANEIVVVRDGAEALDFLYRRGEFSDRNPAAPLVVLLDINMPKINGLEVLEKMKGDPILRMIPVVMLTSSREGPTSNVATLSAPMPTYSSRSISPSLPTQ
jgi:CheY-like chemotaxis protein